MTKYMTPEEFHDACHEAILQCPQFRGYDDDTRFHGFGEFGKIPKKGMLAVVKFWRDNEILWDSGYSEELPQECLELFEKIDSLLDKAIKEALS